MFQLYGEAALKNYIYFVQLSGTHAMSSWRFVGY